MPRAQRMNGFKGDFESSFLSCEKDTELIIRKLFVDSNPYSQELKKLLVINTKDCLSKKPEYDEAVKHLTPKDLHDNGYIVFSPKLKFEEHEELKTIIKITFDNFITNASNPEYRDCTVMFDILCNPDVWDLGNYQQRPLKIAGYIDAILNNAKLTGIGEFQFLGCSELVLNENLAGYCLIYEAVHGVDDRIPADD